MQTMSTDPQYYSNTGAATHPPTNNYYIQNNGMDSRK
jgi:hypothetical protein